MTVRHAVDAGCGARLCYIFGANVLYLVGSRMLRSSICLRDGLFEDILEVRV